MDDKKQEEGGTTSLLDQIHEPKDLRLLPQEALRPLADELRAELIRVVSRTGGHLGAGLGVVELTVALHYVFDTPRDKLIWDVGHQSYPHKILTGRRGRMESLRQGGGLSGFTKRAESIYDPFGAAHAATSISAGLGMAVARDLQEQDHHVVCVIGDGAMSAGMAYEAMNNAGAMDSRLIVILNDNDMSIAPPVGAISAYLARLLSGASYRGLRNFAKQLAKKLPPALGERARRAEEYARGMAMGGTIFEEMGFYYVGPIDGHNLDHLLPVMRNVHACPHGPILMHVVTRKGRGYPPAEVAADKFHGVTKFDVATGAQQESGSNAPGYTKVFSDTLIRLAEDDERIVAITAAMPSGTGLDRFAERFPQRCFDVGIAEQHAVTFAAGLACEGLRPFAAIYSTFLQRAYDQVIHDVAIQNLPVRFAVDRAGLVGADGATHAGSFDMAYLGVLPNFVIMAPADEAELRHMTTTAASLDGKPCAFRFPRGAGRGVALPEVGEVLQIGRGRVLRRGSGLAFVSIGDRLGAVEAAAERLGELGIAATIVDLRFVKPLDRELLLSLAAEHEALVVVEAGCIGGAGSHILELLSGEGMLSGGLRVKCLFLPDCFLDQDSPDAMYRRAGLDNDSIFRAALNLLEFSESTPLQAFTRSTEHGMK